MKKIILSLMLVIILCVSAVGVSAVKMIDVTSGTWAGDSIGGISGADQKCRDEFGPEAQALIGATLRDKTQDWVLTATTPYYRSDGITLIDTTGGDSCFTLDLDEAISASASEPWTGLDIFCVADSAASGNPYCGDWSSASFGDEAKYGDSDSKTNPLSLSARDCVVSAPIYCVYGTEIPPPPEAPEFSTVGILLALIVVTAGLGVFIYKKRK